ncbi:MAG: phosphoribosylanthranilate isomerase [Verrucomicrobia bacterium]|nr:MAG: phosphoribosylanthranilate isomerase [Verrucomicrobiota bacterium]
MLGVPLDYHSSPVSVFIKICGLANAADLAAVAALKPDALGFVLWPKSPRAVRPEQIAEWTRDLPPGLLKIGVFVDPDADAIRRAVEIARLDVVQWHGFPKLGKSYTTFFQALEKTLSGVSKVYPPAAAPEAIRVWTVVRLDREPAPAFVDAVVLDSYSPATPGGTGQTLDWTAARAFVAASTTKVLLAGGLRPENVAEAIRVVQPWGVDVSSGVEAQPGKKNLDAVKRFIELCRAN